MLCSAGRPKKRQNKDECAYNSESPKKVSKVGNGAKSKIKKSSKN